MRFAPCCFRFHFCAGYFIVMQTAAYARVYFMTGVMFFILLVMSSAGNCDSTLPRTNKFSNLNENKFAWCAVHVPQARSRQISTSPTQRGQSLHLPALPLSHSRRKTQGACLACDSGRASKVVAQAHFLREWCRTNLHASRYQTDSDFKW